MDPTSNMLNLAIGINNNTKFVIFIYACCVDTATIERENRRIDSQTQYTCGHVHACFIFSFFVW